MKLSIDYSDGRFTATGGEGPLEIPDTEWEAYRLHCRNDHEWQARLRALENEYYCDDCWNPKTTCTCNKESL